MSLPLHQATNIWYMNELFNFISIFYWRLNGYVQTYESHCIMIRMQCPLQGRGVLFAYHIRSSSSSLSVLRSAQSVSDEFVCIQEMRPLRHRGSHFAKNFTKWLPPWRKGRISCLWIKSVFDCLTIGIINETMVAHMTWVWTFFNNYSNHPRMCVLSTLCGNVDKHSPFDIYRYIYIYQFAAKMPYSSYGITQRHIQRVSCAFTLLFWKGI